MKILSADFIGSSHDGSWRPRIGLPEVAFAGRSNVGKSSLLNSLVHRKKLAHVSSNPGHTRAINFYDVNGKYAFVDLPGYGYAKVSMEERRRWRRLVEGYLGERAELKAVIVIVDLRRDPGEEELDLVGYLAAHDLVPILVATKADKVAKSQRAKARRRVADAFGTSLEQVTLFSAVTGEGKDELWRRIKAILSDRPPARAKPAPSQGTEPCA